MEIQSENIKKYLINNLDLKDEGNIELSDILKIEELNLNRLNYKLKEAKFIPEELGYFKELRKCSLNEFLINDDIKKNISKLEKLEKLTLNHCIITGYDKITNKLKQIYLNYSNFEFVNILECKESLEKMTLKNVINVDIENISKFANITELELLNCEVKKFEFITNLTNLKKLKIIGCNLEKDDIKEKINSNIQLNFSKNEFFYVG